VKVDLLVMTGDVLEWHRTTIALTTGPLAAARQDVVAPDKRLVVLGSHDTSETAQALKRSGFRVLISSSSVAA
jgi:hypothetical protein